MADKQFKTYTFVIGTTDDFDTLDDLVDGVEKGGDTQLNYSTHEFVVPDGLDDELITYVGRGLAFTNDWAMDDTFSFVVDGAL